MNSSMRRISLLLGALLLTTFAVAQDVGPAGPIRPRTLPKSTQKPAQPQKTEEEQPADTSGQASSKASRDDSSAPLGDAQEHPDSDTGVDQLRVWNPHKADKDVEVGDYHMKRKNYGAAESRYREALEFQYNNAAAMYGLAQSLEKQEKKEEAVEFYTKYLSTLPHGPEADKCRAALQRLGAQVPTNTGTIAPPKEDAVAKAHKLKEPRETTVCVASRCTSSNPTPITEHPPQ